MAVLRPTLWIAALFLISCSSASVIPSIPLPEPSGGSIAVSSPVGDSPAEEPADAASILSSPLNDFSLSLFRRLTADAGKTNVFVSPFSISTALSMLLMGARTQSADELRKGLNFDRLNETNGLSVHNMFQELISTRIQNDPSLSLANIAMIQAESGTRENLEKYKSDVSSKYAAEVMDVNFGDGAGVQLMANNWVKSHTNNLIEKILDEPPSSDTRLVLLNAIHFKGKWDKPFSVQNTKKQTFFNGGVNETQVDFMTSTGKIFPYNLLNISGEEVHALELEYTNDSNSMIILLPAKRDGLQKVMESSTFETDLMSGLKDLYGHQVNIQLPKFMIESSFSLNETLKEMGINQIFSREADLSGISGNRNLYVSQVNHKAFVKVDEEGTEAAAVTSVIGVSRSARVSPTADFIADHPFMFLIKDQRSGLFFFVGKVEQL